MKYSRILYWALILFTVYLIIEIIRNMLGGSLSSEQLIIGLLVIVIGLVFQIKDSISKVDAKIMSHIAWHKGQNHKS